MVVLADPALIKHTFQADAKTLHAGSRSPLRKVLGDNSLLGIDEEHHMEQRKLLLPPFKGQRMKAYEPLIEEIAIAEIDRWPVGVEFETAKSMQRITLRAILRAVFGATGARARGARGAAARRGPTRARACRASRSCTTTSAR